MPLPLTVSCFSKIQIGFTFLVPAHPGSPGKRAVKRVCVCVCSVFICSVMQESEMEVALEEYAVEVTQKALDICHSESHRSIFLTLFINPSVS